MTDDSPATLSSPPSTRSDTPTLQTPTQALRGYLEAAASDNTRRSYRSALAQFSRWGGLLPASPDMLVRYLLAQAPRLSPRTLSIHLTAIRHWHRAQGMNDPTDNAQVEQTLRGIRRVHATPQQAAKPLSLEALWRIAQTLEHSQQLSALRDRALLLLGFFGAFRRSELVAISHADLRFEARGVQVLIRRSKTDQTGQGAIRAIARGASTTRCPVYALEHWLEQAGIDHGPVFRSLSRWGTLGERALSPDAVNRQLKRHAKAAGVQDNELASLSSHSLRRGMATAAAQAGVGFSAIKKQGGWRSDQSVWRYIEQGRVFEDNASAALLQPDTPRYPDSESDD